MDRIASGLWIGSLENNHVAVNRYMEGTASGLWIDPQNSHVTENRCVHREGVLIWRVVNGLIQPLCNVLQS